MEVLRERNAVSQSLLHTYEINLSAALLLVVGLAAITQKQGAESHTAGLQKHHEELTADRQCMQCNTTLALP